MDLDLYRISKMAGLEDKRVSELKDMVKKQGIKVRPAKGKKHIVKQDLIDALTKGAEGETEEKPSHQDIKRQTLEFDPINGDPDDLEGGQLTWEREKGTENVAPLSHSGPFVVSHRPGNFTLSFRPEGKHVPMGSFPSLKAAQEEAEDFFAKVQRTEMKAVPPAKEEDKPKAPTGPEDQFRKSIKGLKKIHGKPPIKTNAHLNRATSGRIADAAFKAGMKAPEVIDLLVKEFPQVFKKSPEGKLGQKYDSYWALDDEQGPFALKETKYTILKKSADALIRKLKAKKGLRAVPPAEESDDPGQAVTENPSKQELRDPKAKIKKLPAKKRVKAVRQKWAKHGITDPKEQKAWKGILHFFPDKRYMAEIAGKLKKMGGDGNTPKDLMLLSGNDKRKVVETLKKIGIKLIPKAIDPAKIPPAKTEPPGTADSNPFKPWFKGENPAVDILIRHGGKYLVIRRGRDVNSDGSVTEGALAWPGGFIDPDTENTGVKGDENNPPPHPVTQGKGEDPLDAAWRELEEETGLKKEDFAALGIDPSPLGHFGQDRKWDNRVSPTDPSDSWVTSRPFVIDLPDDFELPIEAALNTGYDDASWKGWVTEEDLEKQIMFAGHHGLLSKARESRTSTIQLDLDRIASLGGSHGGSQEKVDNGPSRTAASDDDDARSVGDRDDGSLGADRVRHIASSGDVHRPVGGGDSHERLLRRAVFDEHPLTRSSFEEDLAFDQANMSQISDTGFPMIGGVVTEEQEEEEERTGGLGGHGGFGVAKAPAFASVTDLDAEDAPDPDAGLLSDNPKGSTPDSENPCKPGKGCSNTWKVFSNDSGYDKAMTHGYRNAEGEQQCSGCAWFEAGRCHMFKFTALPTATCDEWERRQGDEVKGKFSTIQLDLDRIAEIDPEIS